MHTGLYNLEAVTPEGTVIELGRWLRAREAAALAARLHAEIGDEILSVRARRHSIVVGYAPPDLETIRMLAAAETAIAA